MGGWVGSGGWGWGGVGSRGVGWGRMGLRASAWVGLGWGSGGLDEVACGGALPPMTQGATGDDPPAPGLAAACVLSTSGSSQHACKQPQQHGGKKPTKNYRKKQQGKPRKKTTHGAVDLHKLHVAAVGHEVGPHVVQHQLHVLLRELQGICLKDGADRGSERCTHSKTGPGGELAQMGGCDGARAWRRWPAAARQAAGLTAPRRAAMLLLPQAGSQQIAGSRCGAIW